MLPMRLHHGLLLCAALAHSLDPAINFLGRHSVNASLGLARFDWVNTGFELKVESSTEPCNAENITAAMEGHARIAVLLGPDRMLLREFWSSHQKALYSLAPAAKVIAAGGQLTVLKTTEPFVGEHAVTLLELTVPDCARLAVSRPVNTFKLDLYGDSDTASYGVDGDSSKPLECLEGLGQPYENFLDGWVWSLQPFLQNYTAARLDARVQAVSGIGVVKNCVAGFGTPILSSSTMPQILHRTLETEDGDDYSPGEWRPEVIIIYIGSNDYVGHLINPSADQFNRTYAAMVQQIVGQYVSPVPPVLHICTGTKETRPCGIIEQFARDTGQHYTPTFDEDEPKDGCVGHRSASQQRVLASRLAPIIWNLSRF